MNDIRPPRPPQVPPQKRPLSAPPLRPIQQAPVRPSLQSAPPAKKPLGQIAAPVAKPTPAELPPSTPPEPSPVLPIKKPNKLKKALIWLASLIVIVALLVVGVLWYREALTPVNPADETKVTIEVAPGSSPSSIGSILEEKKLIRSKIAFEIFSRLSAAGLQAGTYSLAPSQSTPDIVGQLIEGNIEEFTITFLPGATLAENRKQITKAGYSEEETDAALNKTYDSPLFADRPEGTDLEGYIFGDTYQFVTGTPVEDILKETFDHYYTTLQKNKLPDGFKQHGLNLYEGITLASIIQREVTDPDDEKMVAQVFYSRLEAGTPLGSDVTYQYAAKKMGVDPSPSLNSPYNTRKVAGLPPGPIASPGLGALQAVAQPAATNYLYFLSGDDNVTYFARTDDEHHANIAEHCQIKCATP